MLKKKSLAVSILFAASVLNCPAAEIDTLKVVSLSGVEVVSTPKETGTIRQQPSAVSSIGLEQLSDNQVTSLKGVSTVVPNFFIPDYGSRLTSALYIRGIGSRINTPAVGLYVDNVPYVDKSAFDFNFLDIERIDVLRGPQGTLYGRNAMGGIIKVYTKNPFRYQGTDVSLGYATGNQRRTVSLTHYHLWSEKFAFSGGGYYEGASGFFKNSTTGRRVDDMQAVGVRLRGVYLPTADLKTDLSVSYEYSDEGAYPYYYTGATTGEEQYEDQIGKINNNRENSYRRGMFNLGLNIDYQTSGLLLHSVTGYQNLTDRMFLDQDFLSADIYTLMQKQRINTLSHEVTLRNRKEGRWQWLTGANVMYQWLHTEGPVTFYGDGLDWLADNVNSVMPDMESIPTLQSMGFSEMRVNFRGDNLLMNGEYETPTLGLALFHQSTFHITPLMSVVLGLRLDYEHQSMDYNAPAVVDYGFSMPNASSMMAIDLQDLSTEILYKGTIKRDHVRLLPKFAFRYEPDKDNNFYASAAMGQRSGGYNLQMFSDLLQGAMRVNMIDGIKQGVVSYMENLAAMVPAMPSQIPAYVASVMDENMPQYEAPSTKQIVYRPEYSWNFEAGAHLTPDPRLMLDIAFFYNLVYDQQIARFADSGLGRTMVNAGKSRGYGAEVTLLWKPIRALALTANYGYTNSKFKEYDDGNGEDYSDNYVPFVPMHTCNVDGAYTFGLKSPFFSSLTLGMNFSGAGKIYWTEDNSASQDFYSCLGARVVLDFKFGEVSLWGKNITDTDYNTFYFESASRGYEQHGRPRQFGIDLKLHID